jgi:predicted CxxxxCH...CXXCH cytochrome family protein
MPGTGVIGGLHGNGSVEVVFDTTLVSPEASYDRATGVCAVSCHDRGGARARPAWSETAPMGCSDCHGSPPQGHFPGPCTRCHAEGNATGTALLSGRLHMNGKVDLGDGSGQCGACHGSGDSPWPSTAAHPAHETPSLSAAVACASCHPVPSTVLEPTHLDGVVQVALSGLAVARGATPTWSGGACASVACHGAGLVDPPAVVPVWADASGAASRCGTCHPIPPTQHTPSTSCDRSDCHGGEVAENAQGVSFIAPGGKALHMNGIVDHN